MAEIGLRQNRTALRLGQGPAVRCSRCASALLRGKPTANEVTQPDSNPLSRASKVRQIAHIMGGNLRPITVLIQQTALRLEFGSS